MEMNASSTAIGLAFGGASQNDRDNKAIKINRYFIFIY